MGYPEEVHLFNAVESTHSFRAYQITILLGLEKYLLRNHAELTFKSAIRKELRPFPAFPEKSAEVSEKREQKKNTKSSSRSSDEHLSIFQPMVPSGKQT